VLQRLCAAERATKRQSWRDFTRIHPHTTLAKTLQKC
jgi:hypothetical protein